jgi:N-hydroxyarylamine O-acetyltransferase
MHGGLEEVTTLVSTMDRQAESEMPFDLSAYLDRIGLSSAPPPTVGGLAQLVRAHRLAIPFENLDIPLGRGISIDPDAVFDKLVTRRRGGYCFEQNALLDRAVNALGVEGRPLLARVWLGVEGDDDVPPLTHQLELVHLDGAPWIIDGGFGGSYCPPMPLTEGESGSGPEGARHRLRRHDRFEWMLERIGPDAHTDGRGGGGPDWQRQYSFTLMDVHLADRELSNHWTATRPDTRFTSLVIASRVTADGFVSLNGLVLREGRGAQEACETLLDSAAALHDALDSRFGIALERSDADRLFDFIRQ